MISSSTALRVDIFGNVSSRRMLIPIGIPPNKMEEDTIPRGIEILYNPRLSSPFGPVTFSGKTFVPGQGNNAYVFPGVGLGVLASGSRFITNEIFLAAAGALAGEVTKSDLAAGRVYPSLNRIREVSAKIAFAVADLAHRRGLAPGPTPSDLAHRIERLVYQPDYVEYA